MQAETYFIRHGRDWDIGREEKRRLRENGLIAIHYQPIASIVLDDYEKKHRPFIGRFVKIATEGGLVVSTHPPEPGFWIGKVLPRSSVDFRPVRRENGDNVILKIIQLDEPRYFEPALASRLLAIQPRQQTLCAWMNVGERARQLYENGRHRIGNVADFLPFEQEVICGEFLRSNLAERFRLPQISHFTFPVGRTLPDIDIAGVTRDGERVLAQVTFKTRIELGEKLKSLKRLRGESTNLIMFCNDTDRVDFDGVQFVSVQSAMEEMMRFSPILAKSLGYDP
jgi:hypothetical protein